VATVGRPDPGEVVTKSKPLGTPRSKARRTGWIVAPALASLGILACALRPVDSCIVIVVDTLRADHLSLYGYPRPTSPEIERWAQRGVVFDHAFSTSPWTLPAFGTLLTGELPSVHRAGMWVGPRSRAPLVDTLPTLAELAGAAGIETAAFVSNPYLRGAGSGIGRGFALWESVPDGSDSNHGIYRRADVGVSRALDWIGQQSGRYFVLLHLFDPHFPLRPPVELLERFTDRNSSTVTQLEPQDRPGPGATPEELAAFKDVVIDLYDAEIAFVDREVARLLDALDASGKLADTLVVLTADHGEEIYERDRYDHGHTLFNELLRVPLVVWHPQAKPGRRPELVSWLDLMPSLLEALGVETPPGLAGLSLLETLRGSRLPARRLIADGTSSRPGDFAVIDERHKLVAGPSGYQLFDWRGDPGELQDLWPGDPLVVGGLLVEAQERIADPRDLVGEEIPDEILQQLRALGYVE
jgi:arylsulfatase A-like enzyme